MRRDLSDYSVNKNGMNLIRSTKQWKNWECILMTIFNFKYWFCECHYYVPYGKVISADCKKHD